MTAHQGVDEDAARNYVEMVASDDRVSRLLEDQGVSEVHVYPVPGQSDDVLIVAELRAPADTSSWPFETAGDICAAAAEAPSQSITAVTWLGQYGQLDVGVSARFGDHDCYGSVPIPQS